VDRSAIANPSYPADEFFLGVLRRAFNGTSGNLSSLASAISLNKQTFKDTTVLGNFIE
jgi:hypothetical protein